MHDFSMKTVMWCTQNKYISGQENSKVICSLLILTKHPFEIGTLVLHGITNNLFMVSVFSSKGTNTTTRTIR